MASTRQWEYSENTYQAGNKNKQHMNINFG